MSAAQEVNNLIGRFRRNLKDYQSGKYNETQVRLEFIDPFFEILGWDVHNKKGSAEGAQHPGRKADASTPNREHG